MSLLSDIVCRATSSLRFLFAIASLFLGTLWTWGCSTGSDVAEPSPTISASISDGANGGNTGFYWLPPLRRAPNMTGVFDGSRSPIVRISDLETGLILATFTMTSGPGSDTVRMDPEASQYIVNWHTGDLTLNAQTTYRILVAVNGIELGHADVDVVNRGAELKDVDTHEFITLLDGRTLPIKFRIEEGALPPTVGPSIQPASGVAGSVYTITDPFGRMLPGDVIIFRAPDGGSGHESFAESVSEDGTTLVGTVPGVDAGTIYEVSVQLSLGEDPLFPALLFEVTLPAAPSISPSEGPTGSEFTITDPIGRMLAGDVVVFVSAAGEAVSNVQSVSPDGTTLIGRYRRQART